MEIYRREMKRCRRRQQLKNEENREKKSRGIGERERREREKGGGQRGYLSREDILTIALHNKERHVTTEAKE